MWPDHCIKNTYGEAFHSQLEIDDNDIVIKKGENPLIDSYSAFYDNLRFYITKLDKILKDKNIRNIYICGLALDYCVKFTALDGIDLGYNVYLFKNLTRSVNPLLDEKNIQEMKNKGIVFL